MADEEGSPGDVTRLLISWREGDPGAADRLFALLYPELRELARRQLRAGADDATLGPTALLHEAYLKLVDATRVSARDRGHFFCLAARVMRQIAVDWARRKGAARRGGGEPAATLHEQAVAAPGGGEETVEVDRALTRLEALDPRLGRIVELRYFGGLTVEQTAEVLEISSRTVKREWSKARAFLYHELNSRPSA